MLLSSSQGFFLVSQLLLNGFNHFIIDFMCQGLSPRLVGYRSLVSLVGFTQKSDWLCELDV